MSGEIRFVHLRNHTEYSLCSGAIRIRDIVNTCKKYNMPAVASTDTGNMFGALEFSVYAKDNGIQPIVGSELLLDATEFIRGKNFISQSNTEREESFCKIILLAMNKEGFLNLVALVSDSFLKRDGALTPHIKLNQLKEKSNGIIALCGGYEGTFGKMILNNQTSRIEEAVNYFKGTFPDNRFYIELERHGFEDEIKTENDLIDIGLKYDIPFVATNNCYFMTKDMFEAQDVLSCIGESHYISETDRKRLTPEHYFKTQEEMVELFSDIPEAIENTIKIAKRINVMAEKRKPTLPHFTLKEGFTEEAELTDFANKGLKARLEKKFELEKITDEAEKERITKEYQERMDYELGIINQMGFPGYFLIVSDFINWSKDHDIPVGPGRGSGAGSVVAWAIRVTNIDPLKFSLFFERFLNPERVSMPDFDVDFCQARRGETIQYVKNKYGEESVAQIITFGKLQSKAVIKDVGRVLEMGYNEVDRISKMIPFNTDLSEAIKLDEDFSKLQENDPTVKKLIDIALKLEGLNRHSSVHAAGVVIGDKPLQQICPLYFDGKSDMPVVQYYMKYAEAVGLVKFDFLGLKTLTVIKQAVDFVKTRGIHIDIDNIPLDDLNVFEMLKEGDSFAVFQIESTGMKSILKQIKPDNIEDLIALISLYRPGPMDNIPTFIKRKHGIEKIEYPHPKTEKILKDTYGIIVYQEQVMDIAKALAGYTLGGADLLRRAMGKKIKEEMDKQRGIFVEGCKKFSDIEPGKANEIFDLLDKFASYGFNKSHAAAYAVISYQTAFLKKYYPVEFMTATINMEIIDTDKINIYLQDVKAHNIKILPPDINESQIFFSTEQFDIIGEVDKKVNRYTNNFDPNTKDIKVDNTKELGIRYALAGLKGVGEAIIDEVIKEREKNGKFKDIFDFCERVGPKVVNKKTMESLAKSGVFDLIHPNRRQIVESCEILASYAASAEKEKNSDQMSLLGGFDDIKHMNRPPLARVDDWFGDERYQKEFEAFGFYMSNHPLDTIKKELEERAITHISELEEDTIENGDKLRVAGVVITTSIKSSAKGRYAYVGLSDPSGLIEIAVFNNDLISNNKDLLDDKLHERVVFECTIRKDDGGIRVLGNNIISLKKFIKENNPGSLIKITKGGKKKWSGENGEFKYRKKEEPTEDIVIISREVEKPKILSNIVIKISSTKPLRELGIIINEKKIPADKYTKIIFDIDGENKIDLGSGYYLTALDENRIRGTKGVSLENIEYY